MAMPAPTMRQVSVEGDDVRPMCVDAVCAESASIVQVAFPQRVADIDQDGKHAAHGA